MSARAQRIYRPVGVRKDGRLIWPVLGGSEPPNQPPPPAGQPPAPPAPTPPAPPAPQRPDGVTEAEWAALGDPGKTALVRERAARTAAEQALAAARATPPPAPPRPADPPKGPDGQPDIAAIVQQAVAAAVAPFTEAQAQRDAEAAAAGIRDAVTAAASVRFHDASDALAHVNLATLTDGTGRPDQQKITAALDELLTRKPHLGKVIDNRLQAPPGAPIGGGNGAAVPLDDRVKATLARMQQAAGVKFAGA